MKMHLFKYCLLVIGLFGVVNAQDGNGPLKSSQMKYPRVKAAYDDKYKDLKTQIIKSGHSVDKYQVYLQVFKMEKEIKVWIKDKGDVIYEYFKSYPICASSGELGPKRQQGDGQVPEGFYTISKFNPVSSYHLSMKVDYPNKSDLMKAEGKPGGDIMVHGDCVTIGCIPIENDPIEELYILCLEAKDRKNKIRIDIFPCKMTNENMEMLSKEHKKDLLHFWQSLKPAYDYFLETYCVPVMEVDKNGSYILKRS